MLKIYKILHFVWDYSKTQCATEKWKMALELSVKILQETFSS